ncbi:MAG: endonuclease/exonuclease/phosphatase family protein [Bdellovibrionales bacterium]
MKHRILFSNVGYAKGIDGSLTQHVMRFGRHFYCPVPVQQQVLGQLKAIIHDQKPDICCFVEVDSGSFTSSYFNHLQYMTDEAYPFSDIADKYGEKSRLGRLPLFSGKSNGFLARENYAFDRIYFAHGAKRLMYRLRVSEDTTIFFGHFSLKYRIRQKQLEEMNSYVRATKGNVIVLADFNILNGLAELTPLLNETNLRIMNDESKHTFRFYNRQHVLDVCLCSEGLLPHAQLHIIPQPFSDHAALLLDLDAGRGV